MPSKLVPRAVRPSTDNASRPPTPAHPGDNAAWRALVREPILEPELAIVDSHHHLWERGGERYLLPDYLADLGSGHAVRASVFVECGAFYRRNASDLMAPVGEVEFANRVAEQAVGGPTAVCVGIVGTADLTTGAEAARVLDAHMETAPQRFRGIRLITKWDADETLNNGRYAIQPGLLTDADFRAGFRELAARGLSFDAMVYHPQLPELAALARAFPDTTIVLNHIGGLLALTRTYRQRKDDAIASWRGGLAALARCPKVYVKLGGLGMPYLGFGLDALPEPASSEQLAQAWGSYFAACIEAFGPRRCMFESNFPPDRASVDFPILWNAFKRFAARYSAEEKRALFFETAVEAYRLDL